MLGAICCLLLALELISCCCRCRQMFESIWYKCSKLNSDLVNRASTAYDMEVEALQHILAWLGERLQIWVVGWVPKRVTGVNFSWSSGPALHMSWKWRHHRHPCLGW
jgi:hypothetical protein